MFTAEAVLAAVLLTCPVSTPGGWEECLWPSVRAIASNAEIVDVLERNEPGLPELQDLSRRLHDAPSLGEVYRFPNETIVLEQIHENQHLMAYLTARQKINTDERLHEAIRICAANKVILTTLKAAQQSQYASRRERLRALRDLIGAEAFYEGRLRSRLWSNGELQSNRARSAAPSRSLCT